MATVTVKRTTEWEFGPALQRTSENEVEMAAFIEGYPTGNNTWQYGIDGMQVPTQFDFIGSLIWQTIHEGDWVFKQFGSILWTVLSSSDFGANYDIV